MQVKRERSHQCGLSNLDFRRLNDDTSITKYYNDLKRSDFGLMGRSHVPYAYQSCDFGNRQSLLIHSGLKVPEPPNPRYAETQRYYERAKKPFLLPANVEKKRVTHLENFVWDDKVFTGENVKQKNWYRSKVPLDKNVIGDLSESTTNKIIQAPKRGDKLDKHEKALQETQLVKVTNKETLEGLVDIQKVKEIRRALRRRYGNRLNYHKIFNAWDRDKKGYLNLDDVHYMINSMGININIQEARVMIASHDHEGAQRLTMEEFMDLIFSTNDNMNVDLSKMKFNAEFVANDEIMLGIQNDAAKLKKIKNEKMFKYVLQKSLKELFKEFKEIDEEKKEKINYDQFVKAIKDKVQLPGYIKENETLFVDLYSDQKMNEEGEINYQKFCEGIRNFRYVGETDINIDLGEGKAAPIIGEVKRDVGKPETDLHVFDIQKVPANQLEKIFTRTLRVSRMLKAKYKTKESFDKDLKEQLKFDKYGNISSDDFEKYLLNICQEQLNKRELNRKDLEGFMSAFRYNIYKTTDINGIAPLVFSDDTQISAKIHSLQRAMPPPSKIDSQEQPNNQDKEETKKEDKVEPDNLRMREVIKELQLKSFENKKYIYTVFKDYDQDCDGYVSHEDIKKQFKNLKIEATDDEVNKFIELTDPNNKGYLDFSKFALVITPNMSENLAPLPKTEENLLFRRERSNLAPNPLKVEENIEYHKTFNDRFIAIRDTLLPDKNLLLSPNPTTRFGAKPSPANTFLNFQPPAGSGMYISEQQRFHKPGNMNTRLEFQKEEKRMRDSIQLAKVARIHEQQKFMEDIANERDLKQAIELKKQIQNRTARRETYEKKMNTVYEEYDAFQ